MSLFGFSIVRSKELEVLRESERCVSRMLNASHWFSGWRDLYVIWNFILNEDVNITKAREDYASLRSTDVYGNQIKSQGKYF